MNTTALRIFNIYGPRAHYEGDAGEVIPRRIVRILAGEPLVVFEKSIYYRFATTGPIYRSYDSVYGTKKF